MSESIAYGLLAGGCAAACSGYYRLAEDKVIGISLIVIGVVVAILACAAIAIINNEVVRDG